MFYKTVIRIQAFLNIKKNTVQSIRQTAGNSVDIILVNDASSYQPAYIQLMELLLVLNVDRQVDVKMISLL